MVSHDAKVYKKILLLIINNGPMDKLKALSLCVGVSQLERILEPPSKLIEHYGKITTKDELENRIKGNPSGLLISGHDTCGIGGVHRNV